MQASTTQGIDHSVGLALGNYELWNYSDGTRVVFRGVSTGIHFNLGFGSTEFLDKSSERQLGAADELVAGRSAGEFAGGNDYELRL